MGSKLNFLDGATKLRICDHLRNGVEKHLPFKSWEDAEVYFTRFANASVTKHNIKYCVSMTGQEIELVKPSESSPMAQVCARLAAVEKRLEKLESDLGE